MTNAPMPELLHHGGLLIWLLLGLSAVAVLVFIERLLYYHREQIHAAEFLNGIKNVIKRGGIVEALAICDATPGPVPRLVKAAILSRERGTEGILQAVRYASLNELPRLEQRLGTLATIAQIAPLIGLLGTVLGLIDVFYALQNSETAGTSQLLFEGVWRGLSCTAVGLALSIPCYAGYNYLVSRVNSILLDMDKTSAEIEQSIVELLVDK